MNFRDLLHPASKRVFLTPQDFLSAAVDYFEWCVANPLEEEHLFAYQGEVTRASASKVRPFTKKALATFLHIPESRLDAYCRSEDESWAEAGQLVDQIIYTQKFENAAAGLLSASIIGRDLGLSEKTEVAGPGGSALTMVVGGMTPAQAAEAYRETLHGNAASL